MADYFAYLQFHCEDLTQFQPLSGFSSKGAIAAKHLNHQHTYQFHMGSKTVFESLRTPILNPSPMPLLFEALANRDEDEHRHRLLRLPIAPLPDSSCARSDGLCCLLRLQSPSFG